ncbi:MAG: S-layer homology domain-containing protein [Acidimicrobiaceae bacterium]|nr:S-layer homology domain-containing protein [Acidimicrobiaceae bacterium]
MLAAGALIASLFAVGAAPAAAVDDDSEQDHKATSTACLGDAVQDQGFTDLGTLDYAVSSINCLAYYRIAAGTSADTFDPSSNVTRRHMALFLYAAAGRMGVDLMGGDMMVDFGDISELGEDMQNAITALARNGILSGRGDMAFDPFGDITRAEMAVALVNLLDHTPGAPVHKNKAGLFILGDDAQTAALPNDSFADAYASQSQPVNNAISAAYELGITSGVGDGTMFGPSQSVSRANMAVFITNALAHSNARPAGLTAQVANGTITVSVRDASFAPVPNQAIDAFRAAVAFEDKAFKDDGTCSSRTTLVDGATKCEIDGADPVTDSGGNSMLAQLDAATIGKGLTVWLWDGDVGDKFGNDTDYFEMSVMPTDTGAPTASSSDFKTDVAQGATKVHFSVTVTVTIQLQGDEDTTDPDNDLTDVGPGDIGGDDGIEYTVVINKRANDPTADPIVDPTTGDSVFDTKTIKAKVNDDGAATFTVDATDVAPDTAGNRVMVDWTISGGDFSSDTPAGPNLTPDPATGNVIFSDETAAAAAVKAEVAPFQDAPGAGERAGSAVTVTVTDQFGRPFKNAGIVLTSSRTGDVASVMPTRARTTGTTGQVRIGYSYTGGASAETITATYIGPDGDITATTDNLTTTATAYWVTSYVDVAGANGQADVIFTADLDSNQIVYDPTGGDPDPTSVNYDSGDYFIVDGAPASYEAFEEALGKGVEARNAALAAGEAAPTPFTIQFTSYVFDDPSDIAQFTLVTE